MCKFTWIRRNMHLKQFFRSCPQENPDIFETHFFLPGFVWTVPQTALESSLKKMWFRWADSLADQSVVLILWRGKKEKISVCGFKNTAIFVWPWKIVSVSVRYRFYQPMDEKIKTWRFVFPPKKTLIRRRHCSMGQYCCSMTSKRSISWFPESSKAWSFFTQAFAYSTKSHACLYPFDEPIKSLYFRSFVVSLLFARFHFKVIRKSRYPDLSGRGLRVISHDLGSI